MNSSSPYIHELLRSSHRVAVTPLRPLDVLHLFLRFQVGRSTIQDNLWFRFSPTMDIGAFVEVNGIEVLDLGAAL